MICETGWVARHAKGWYTVQIGVKLAFIFGFNTEFGNSC